MLGGAWIAQRSCEAFEELSVINDVIPVARQGDEFILERGREGQPGFLSVRGKPDPDGTLMLSGTIISAAAKFRGQRSGAFFKGRLVNDRYELQGRQGRRACTLTLQRRLG